ncbi:sulfate ABC transporter, ATP-binding protein [Lentilactobacillus hilgardii ATCC 27305]|jgi:sulfate transport system ATP-binding protein|nr:sulfate ABC transporter, ATP-binding protein [Lentilactobacillus hilgardii ATCC 27305]
MTFMYIQINHISKAFQKKGQNVLHDISFGVKKGSLTALLGPSGSGKTTLLRILAGLETATSGNASIDGHAIESVAPQNRGIGFVFQNYALFRYLNVYQNIAFGLKTQHQPANEIKKRVTELLKLTGLTDLENRYPNQLSGGQKQRVAFARAIAPHPKVLFLDEPFAALDKQIRQELRIWLKRLIHQLGITSIFVTHDHEEAIETADEIVVMNEGYVKQIGTPNEIYNQPNCQFVAEFIGRSSVLSSPNLAGFMLPEKPFVTQIRPERVQVLKKDESTTTPGTLESATVKDVVFRGATTTVTLDLHGQSLLANRSSLKPGLVIGEHVSVLIEQLVLFKQDTSTLKKNQSPATTAAPLKSYAIN